MRIKIKTSYDKCMWVTPQKVYEAKFIDDSYSVWFGTWRFIADNDQVCYTSLTESPHLNGNDWEIVIENQFDADMAQMALNCTNSTFC